MLVPDPGCDPYGAVSAIVAAVTTLAGDPSMRQRLGTRGRQRALAYFSAERMVTDFAKLTRTVGYSRRPTWPDERNYCPPHLLPFGRKLLLGDDEVAMEFLKEGWSHGEGEGRWTDGDQARLRLILPEDCRNGLVLTCGMKPFLGSPGSTLKLRLTFNDREVSLICWAEPTVETQQISLAIWPDSQYHRGVELVFCLTGACSPASLGLSDDSRRLGVWVTFLQLDRLQSLNSPDFVKPY